MVSRLTILYALTVSIIVAHEVDSGFWAEWELFHLPGGHGLFAWVHVPLVAAALWGLVATVRGERAGAVTALLLGGAGIAGGILHGGFLLLGDVRFADAPSVALIATMVLASLALAVAGALVLRKAKEKPGVAG